MQTDRSAEITGLLKAWSGGDAAALDRLTTLVYQELRRIARRYMRTEKAGNTLQTTALVNEVYLRLVDVKKVDCQDRAQFFALSAQLMRRILVDAARARGSDKRGGGVVKIEVNEAAVLSSEPARFILALDEALEELAKLAPRQAKVVELRYFGGMSEEETAEAMKTSPRTVRRDWQFAKAWLTRDLSGRPEHE
jgi:RNA polymerase sigma factor (TIGR02999 family)